MNRKTRLTAVIVLLVVTSLPLMSQRSRQAATGQFEPTEQMFSALSFRMIGPAAYSGRIADIAVNPNDFSEFYLAVASGGLWKTSDGGANFRSIFDDHGVYAMGAVTIDPNNTDVVWLGTGENNSQRALGIGNGVYKSTDGGETWVNTGLHNSAHIGNIVIDPRNSDVVYVAAHGPAWGPGGDRGLYKTTDGGATWDLTLYIGEYTGINDLVMDPRNPDILIASAHQRERRVYSKINGGPESGMYKSTDAGATWRKLENGFPSEGNIGRIGIAMSPVNPDIVYAMVEMPPAERDLQGFYRSKDQGESWERMSGMISASPQYYQRLIPDPIDENIVVSMDVRTRRTRDGGANWEQVSLRNRHVDDHCLWINPTDNRHYRIGGDGGFYESWNGGNTWKFSPHIPITQYYRVRAGYEYPFYNVYGGTQDNGSWYGPSRTIRAAIVNADWKHTLGGDGFLSTPDPEDATISYHESQYGGLARYDHLTETARRIKPRPLSGVPYRFNWDAPYFISHFDHKTLYFGAQLILKSTDRGNTWKEISPDLTRQIDVDTMPMMGQLWDRRTAVALHSSTSPFGNLKALMESPFQQGMIYAGTDDGLIWRTEDDGETWVRYDTFPGVPDMTMVTSVIPSIHDINTVYATFDGKKNSSDWTPYVLKSTDRGESWVSIASNLPYASAYRIIEDHINPDILFLGNEYGVWVTIDGGAQWFELSNGIPPIQVPDIDIQRRENDLVVATFGRGFYILEDYSYLRELNSENLSKPAHIFEIKDSWQFSRASNFAYQGDAYFRAPNPPVAVNIRYHIAEEQQVTGRRARSRESDEVEKELVFTITSEDGSFTTEVIRPYRTGVNRLSWNMVGQQRRTAPPGNYTVSVALREGENVTELNASAPFTIKRLDRDLLREVTIKR